MDEKNIELLMCRPGLNIKQAWELINKNSSKILFVTDENKVLLGTICDGDIRRWILANNDIHENICKAMNHDPICASETDSRQDIQAIMLANRVDSVPQVDEDHIVKDIFFLSEIVEAATRARRKRRILQVPMVIMAGGIGSRLNPFTKILPKPLIPIGDKPIIQIIIDRFHEVGVQNFLISLNYKANMIEAYFSDAPSEYALKFYRESTPLGTAGSLHLMKTELTKTFFLSNCDILIDADYCDIYDFHRSRKASITMVCSMKHTQIPYGVVEIAEGGAFKAIQEKPEFNNLVNTGVYILEPKVLELVPKGQYFDMTSLLEKAFEKGHRIVVYPISDKDWIDIGQLEEYQNLLRKTGVL